MKNLFLLIFAVVVLASCDNRPSKDEYQVKQDSLMVNIQEKEKAMNDLVASLVEIDQNVQRIKEQEKIITLDVNKGGEMNKTVEERINNDVQQIYNLLLENKEKVAKLQKQLNNSRLDIKKLNVLVESLTNQVKAQEEEIAQLKTLLEEKNIKIEGLTQSLDSLQSDNTATKENLDETTNKLYTAYYAMGTKKELIAQKLLSAGGIFTKAKINPTDFNMDFFTKIDIRNTLVIDTHSKKVELLSNHPADSYNMVGGEGEKTIQIIDKDKFWSLAKYLIIKID